MNGTRTSLITAAIAVLCVVVALQFARDTRKSIELSFADEQTEIFSQMTTKATEALNQIPPDVRAAIGFLEYVHSYYPSGTKQTDGSLLDRVVERSRTAAEARIIDMLRVETGLDLGMDPEAWIRECDDLPAVDK